MKKAIIIFIIMISIPFHLIAGILVGGTRVILDDNKKDASISIKNPDNKPYLIQSWIDSNGEKDEIKNDSDLKKLIATPPLFRLNAKSENNIRILKVDEKLPTDRESVYWLNIKSIPQTELSDGRNVLQLSVKTRIKVFYRPKNISHLRDFKGVSFTYDSSSKELNVSNPTPFYITFYSLKVSNNEIDTANKMVPPFGSVSYKTKDVVNNNITWSFINDYGGISKIFETKMQ